MSGVFDPARLVRAWELWDERPGNDDLTKRMVDAVYDAAATLGVSPSTLTACIQAERRADPGHDVAGAVGRVLAGLSFEVVACGTCGVEMPNYQIYRDFHAEHCPEIGPQRSREVETVESL